MLIVIATSHHCHSAERAQQMYSSPSPVQPELCFTPAQTQLFSVITSISGCLSRVLNYKSCKTWIKLFEPLMGGEGAITLSLRFNWPNFSKASSVASRLWFIGSVFVVSLNKFLLASSPMGHKEKPLWLRGAVCWIHIHSGTRIPILWSYRVSPLTFK